MDYYNSASSTSFECDCYICQTGLDCRTIPQTPFYPTMGQPLVYFADCSNKRRKKSNCFVRAFHWYTGDLHPDRNDRPSNLGSFATWLDDKYEQFLLENPNACGVKVTQTSLIQACTPPCTPETRASNPSSTPTNNQRANKRSAGKSRSQKRRRGRGKSEERASSDDRANQSMEYIMPPKELNRAASEGYRVNTPASSPSTQQRNVIKSQSLTSVEKEHSEDDKSKAPVKFDNPPVEKKSPVLSKRETKVLKKELTISNRSCQCFVEVDKIDADTQYDASESDTAVEEPQPKNNQKKRKTSLQQQSAKGSKSSVDSKKANVICECPVQVKKDTQVQSVEVEVQSVNAEVQIVEPPLRSCVCPTKVKIDTKIQGKPCEPPRPCKCPKKVKVDAQVQVKEPSSRPCICPTEVKVQKTEPPPRPCECPKDVKVNAEVQTKLPPQRCCKCLAKVKVDAQVQSKESPFRPCECPSEANVDVQIQCKDSTIVPCECSSQPDVDAEVQCEDLTCRPCECPVEIQPCVCPTTTTEVQVNAHVQSEQLLLRPCECPVEDKTDAEVQSEVLPPSAYSAVTYRQTCLQCHCLVCHDTAVNYNIMYSGVSQSMPYAAHTSHQSMIISTASTQQVVIGKCSHDCPSVKELDKKCSRDCPGIKPVDTKCSRDCAGIKPVDKKCSRDCAGIKPVDKKCSRDCPGIKKAVGKCRPDCPGAKHCPRRSQGTECVCYQVSYAQTSDHAIDLEREVRTVQGVYPFYLKVVCADKN